MCRSGHHLGVHRMAAVEARSSLSAGREFDGLIASEPALIGPRFSLPVFGADSDLRQICGTAFSIGRGVFMTASHVLESASSHQVVAIGYPYENRSGWKGLEITEKEPLGNDIAICKADVAQAVAMPWMAGSSVAIFGEVQSMGYPHGLDTQHRSIAFRGFSGHVVSEVRFPGLPGRPQAYELSFQCPRGLSGAPLWLTDTAEVVGVIVSNAIMEMEVSRETETLKEPDREIILIKTEALHLGIALTANEIIGLSSKLLGGTVGEWLASQQLLTNGRYDPT